MQQDSAFEFMPHSSYTSCLAPKVAGSWNLHTHLPPDMDFFIMLSSICGIVGNRGQSNYAAGNTYQDALATYRRARGLAASTLDLGNILSVGYIAENQATLNANPLFFFAHDGVREDEFLALVEHHVDRRRGLPVARPARADVHEDAAVRAAADAGGRGGRCRGRRGRGRGERGEYAEVGRFAGRRGRVGAGGAGAAAESDDERAR